MESFLLLLYMSLDKELTSSIWGWLISCLSVPKMFTIYFVELQNWVTSTWWSGGNQPKILQATVSGADVSGRPMHPRQTDFSGKWDFSNSAMKPPIGIGGWVISRILVGIDWDSHRNICWLVIQIWPDRMTAWVIVITIMMFGFWEPVQLFVRLEKLCFRDMNLCIGENPNIFT